MTATGFDTERDYDDERFSTVEVFRSDRMKVVCGYFEPGQFIPVHAPSSDAEHEPVRTGRADARFDPQPGDL